MKRLTTYILIILLLSSCFSDGSSNYTSHSDATHLQPKYAQGFDIYQHDDFTEIQILNPWKKGQVAAKYYLVQSDTVVTPEDGIRIKIPLHNVASTSVTQYEFLSLLGECGSIKGICSPKLVYNHTIDSLFKTGKITDLGDAFNINKERLIMLAPDAVLGTFYNENSISKAIDPSTGIVTIYDNEWTESTILARTEWIKFIAAFYGKSSMADSIFNIIDSSYQTSLAILENITSRKSVMVGNNYRGTWYMPGGKSYMCNLLKDAHAYYLYENDTTTGSLPLNFEQVLTDFADCDVWLNAPVSSIEALVQMDERHALFRPVKTGNVFAFKQRVNASGANDFWESGIAHPDIILNDIIWALYPSLMPDYVPTYINKCE
ncbi:MAG: ABC transporter substrate-binding protein [Paludibacteraceae bacterium]|nr:ABC transporter substrate-binding protein [Paludibacteraceae bacterium]